MLVGIGSSLISWARWNCELVNIGSLLELLELQVHWDERLPGVERSLELEACWPIAPLHDSTSLSLFLSLTMKSLEWLGTKLTLYNFIKFKTKFYKKSPFQNTVYNAITK